MALDATYINNLLKTTAVEYFKEDSNVNTSAGVVLTSKIKTRKGDLIDQESTGTCKFIDTPEFIMELFNLQTNLLCQRQDRLVNDIKEEFNELIKQRLEGNDLLSLRDEVRTLRNDNDALSQYNRRDNLIIEGVEYADGENTNEICKEISAQIGYPITDADISVSHRIMSNNKNTQGQQEIPGAAAAPTNKRKPPRIILRVNRRDVKTKLFENRKQISSKPNVPIKYKNVAIYEDLTPLRSRIMYELRSRGDRKAFKYVWSRGGRMYCRPTDDADKTTINTPQDLAKVGFSSQEIEDIIHLKKK